MKCPLKAATPNRQEEGQLQGCSREEGLWRVDAAYVEGRQVARAVGIAALPAPTGLVCLPNGEVAVSHGTESSRIIRFSPRVGGPKEPTR